MTDPKKEFEKPAVSNPIENKLTDEELNCLSRRAEIDNLVKTNLSNKENINSAKNLKALKQVEVRNRHGGYIWYGDGAVILSIILVIILV